MTKRQMEQAANRMINSENAPSEMSETHLEVLRSYGFQFGRKTGSRFIAAVHEIVSIVSAAKITEMQGTILALQFDVNDINDRLIKQTEKTKTLKDENENLSKKLAVVEDDFLKAVKETGELKVAAEKAINAASGRIIEMAAHARQISEKAPNDQMARGAYHAYNNCVKLFTTKEDDNSEPITMSMCANKADFEAEIAKATKENGGDLVGKTVVLTLNEKGMDQIKETGFLAPDHSGIEKMEIKSSEQSPAPMTDAETINEASNRG